MRRPVGTASLALAAVATLGGLALAGARRAARGVPLSPLVGGRVVGVDYPEREGIVAPPHPAGEMDDLGAYARPGFDPEAVHPAVRRFYERTAEYVLSYRTTWHPGFRTGAALASPLTSRLKQLNLPGRSHGDFRVLRSRFLGVDPAADPRDGARAWIRTGDSGEAVFVAIYASHGRGGETYVNIAVPLPRSNLSTVLRLGALDAGDEDGTGIELTTDGDGGLYLVTPAGAFALPMAQTFRVWPARSPDAPVGAPDARTTVVATHDMWLLGRKFLTVEYLGRPATDREET